MTSFCYPSKVHTYLIISPALQARGIQANKHELHAISPKKAWGEGGRESSKSKCMHARARPGKFSRAVPISRAPLESFFSVGLESEFSAHTFISLDALAAAS